MIGYYIFQKRTTMLPWWLIYNKFFVRDTITICWNATDFARSIKFWSLEHDHDGIWHRFIHSRGLTHIKGRIFDTTKVHILVPLFLIGIGPYEMKLEFYIINPNKWMVRSKKIIMIFLFFSNDSISIFYGSKKMKYS